MGMNKRTPEVEEWGKNAENWIVTVLQFITGQMTQMGLAFHRNESGQQREGLRQQHWEHTILATIEYQKLK